MGRWKEGVQGSDTHLDEEREVSSDAESREVRSGKSASSLRFASAAMRSLRCVSESDADIDTCNERSTFRRRCARYVYECVECFKQARRQSAERRQCFQTIPMGAVGVDPVCS